MSSPNSTFLQSLNSFSDSSPTNSNRSNSHFKRAMFSSLRVKKQTQRPSLGEICDSQWSLYSANSLSFDEYNWSLQPNYLKMMNDTNLMDNCAAAKKEIESIRECVPIGQSQFLQPNISRARTRTVNPEQLLQWIVYMEKYLKAFSPNWREVNEMDELQRNASFNEQCDLRQYIASHNGIFNQMVREEDTQRTRDVQDKFHKLLLNAIEMQCLLEGYPTVEDDAKVEPCPDTNINLDVYKLCSIDIEPQVPGDGSSNVDHLDHTLIRSTESLSSNSDRDTIITSDDGIGLPTHPTTSSNSVFSEDHCSPFSSHPDFQCKENENLESILKELESAIDDDAEKNRKESSSSISACSLNLIKDVDSVLPKVQPPNVDECVHANKKVDKWLTHHPNESKYKNNSDVGKKLGYKMHSSSSSSSDLDSCVSIQWDNFQDIYTLTAPIDNELSNDFLYFGDDYDDALKSKRHGSLSSMHKSSTSAPTTPSKSEKNSECQRSQDETIESKSVSRRKKRIMRKLNKKIDPPIQQSIPDDSSKMAKDILLIVEDLRKNYMNLKPNDFDGILKLCRENLGCLIVVLDKDQPRHYQSNESVQSIGDDRIYIQENCRCGVIGQIVASIVWFLYDCSRIMRRSAIYRFLLRILKHFYAMVKFLGRKVRVYRSLYGKY